MTTRRPQALTARFIAAVCENLAAGKQVRRALPEWGRVHIDRQLPFLAVYRRPARREDAGTERFVMGEASYLTAPPGRQHRVGVIELVHRVAETLTAEFGAFLVVEAWTGAEIPASDGLPPPPFFRILAPKEDVLANTAAVLRDRLARVRISKQRADVTIAPGAVRHPPGFAPLFAARENERGWHWLGVEVAPIWRRADAPDVFPLVRRSLTRQFGKALRRSIFEFTRAKTTHRPRHFHSLGKRAMVKAVWEVDRQLGAVSDSFDFLLQVTPVNPASAYLAFERSRFTQAPTFYYRPLPKDPALLKRRLYDIRIERVEDPTLAQLFRQKRRELDLQINLILERDTPRALYSSLQLYGPVGEEILATAHEILRRIRPRAREDMREGNVDAEAFARAARDEFDFYARHDPAFQSEVEIRDDLVGLMVSRGRLLVGRRLKVPAARVDALLQHEIGTHVLTYFNGSVQPFQQLHCGLAGYDELQEGLAVLAEYLVGGLSRPRLRLLAARVVAAHRLVEGASFVETFRLLDDEYGFDRRTAFTIAMRIYRAGGVTKDAIYLRGFVELLKYLGDGGELDPLFAGKMAAEHVPVILELQRRKVLHAATLRPRYLDHPDASGRLERVRTGLDVLELAGRKR